MKALIIGPFPPLRGGISDFNYELVNELEKSCLIDVVGFKINYPTFLRSKNKQIHKNNILKKSISYINPYNPFDWFRIKKLVKKNKYNFVISTYWTPITGLCYYFINNLIGKNCKKIGLFHNLIPHEKFMFSELILKKFLKNLDKTVTLSKYNQHILEENYNSKSLKLYHPINNVKTVSKEESLNYLKLDKKYEYILFFGLVRKYKGLDILLNSIKDIKSAKKNIKLIIAGEFIQNIKNYKKMINSLGINNDVIIKNEFINSDEIKFYFGACELVVQPYKKATQSGVSSLGIAYGKKIVTTNVGGLTEYLNEKNSFISNTNSKSLTNKIIDAFNDQTSEKTKNIRKLQDKLSWNNFCKKLLKL